ncbi:MAG: DNA adenine methylase, partial [Anaerolineales bacterium]
MSLRLIGSKGRLSQSILALIPAKSWFIEPFAGSGRVSLALLQETRHIHTRVWLNDLDPAIYNYWIALKMHNMAFRAEAFRILREYNTTSAMREWYMRERRLVRDLGTLSSIPDRAATYFLLCAYSYRRTGLPNESFQEHDWNSPRRLSATLNKMARLEPLLERAEVTNLDYWDCIQATPSEESYYFFD